MIPDMIKAETFSYNGTSYVIENTGYTCSLNEEARFIQLVKDFYVFSYYGSVEGEKKN